jgi:hypothetical protein
MIDIYNIIQDNDSYNESPLEYVKIIIKCKDISKFKIDWMKYLHLFYIDKLKCDEICIEDLIKDNIKLEFDINNFFQLNIKFNILNKLNTSYNHILNHNDYTLLRLQDIYIDIIINNRTIANNMFNYIININLINEKSKSMLVILKDYLKYREPTYNIMIKSNNIVFIELYSKWVANYFIKQFYSSTLELNKIFENLIQINKINELFLEIRDRSHFTIDVIEYLLILLEPYLDNVLEKNLSINDIVIDTFNIINLSKTKYNDIIIKFLEKWLSNIKKKNYPNNILVDNLLKISPIINKNKSSVIINYNSTIYNNRLDLFDYLMTLLDNQMILYYDNIIQFEINNNFTNLLSLILLYDNKQKLWDEYFKHLYRRVYNYLKINNLSDTIIKYEKTIIQIIMSDYNIDNIYNKFSTTTKTFLDNLEASIINKNNFQKCNFNFVNIAGEKQICDISNISNVDYIIIDKHVYDGYNKNDNLISSVMYPAEIKQYILMGEAYYNRIYEIYKIEFYIEQSIINITVNNMNIICNIIQYTLISYIVSNEYTIDELIDHISNKESNVENTILYLKSYINNLLSENIIKRLSNNKLIISNKDDLIKYDISIFEPTLESTQIIQSDTTINDDLIIDKESTNYLRYLILVKMFKHNSTRIFELDDIIKSVLDYIDNTKLNNNLKSIFNLNQDELNKCLLYIESRDIIEQVNKDKYKYVV